MDPWQELSNSKLTEEEIIPQLKANQCSENTLSILLKLLLPLQKKGFHHWYIYGDSQEGIEGIWDDDINVIRIHVCENEDFEPWPKETFSIWMAHRHEEGSLTSRCRIFNHSDIDQALHCFVALFPPLLDDCPKCQDRQTCPYCSFINSYIR